MAKSMSTARAFDMEEFVYYVEYPLSMRGFAKTWEVSEEVGKAMCQTSHFVEQLKQRRVFSEESGLMNKGAVFIDINNNGKELWVTNYDGTYMLLERVTVY